MNWDTSIENFKNYLKLERGLSMNTIKSYEFDLFQFKNFIIKNDINESPQKCSSSTVKRYLYKNFSKKKSRSQARSISALKSFFNYLLFEGKINSSPLNDIESPKIENSLPEVLTEDEIKRLISSVNLDSEFGQRNKTIIEVLYGTGIRVSELTELRLSNIFFEENILKVTGKGNKERFVPLGKIASIEIKKYLTYRDKLKINSKFSDILFL
jgi:Site-specific recombinase XerD